MIIGDLMGKTELENKKKEIKIYRSSFERYAKELENISDKLSGITDFNNYSATIKPEIDKILYIISDLIYDSNKIKEDKTIKKFLLNEFNLMVESRNKVNHLRKEIELKIPKQNN